VSAPGTRHLVSKREAVASFLEFARGGASPRYPLEMYLEVSNVCDLRCVMCTRFSAFNPARKQAIWDVDPGFLDAGGTSEALRGALERALVVHAFGYGEPTIHPEFPAFLAHLAEHEVLVDFFTNGMHLTEDFARLLVELSVHHITVSFSGATAADYESVYQGGSFERVVGGLARLRDARRAAGSEYPRVHLNSLTFDHHVRTLDRFVELAASLGVQRVELTRLLEHTAVIPAMDGHAANLRAPDVRRAIARAGEAAKRLGVELALHPMIEAELALGTERSERGAGSRRIPLSEFRAVADALPVLPPSREGGPRLHAIDPEGDTVDEIRRRLQVRPYPQPGAEPFYCLEPFKTFYLRRGGMVKTCCYATDTAEGLGDIRRSTAEEIWGGKGYEVFRGAVRNGQYPMSACAHCLDHRQAPASHGVDAMLRDYRRWNPSAEGPFFDRATIDELAASSGNVIVERSFQQSDAGRDAPGAGERVSKLLAQVRADPAWWPAIEGWVDFASEIGVAGWVYSPLFTDLRFPVSLWVGDRKLAESVADRRRPDLAGAARGDGRYGFAFPIGMSREEARVARVELGSSGLVLERISDIRDGRVSAPATGVAAR